MRIFLDGSRNINMLVDELKNHKYSSVEGNLQVFVQPVKLYCNPSLPWVQYSNGKKALEFLIRNLHHTNLISIGYYLGRSELDIPKRAREKNLIDKGYSLVTGQMIVEELNRYCLEHGLTIPKILIHEKDQELRSKFSHGIKLIEIIN